jgi:hypothetical protein
MALSLLPQPRIVRTLGGFFDFRDTDAIYVSRKSGPEAKAAAKYLSEELGRILRTEYQVKISSKITTPDGLIITHHSREGIYVPAKVTKPEGYELLVSGHSVMISAVDPDGLFRAAQTTLDLLQDGSRVPTLSIQDWPLVRQRAIHLDLKGLTPNAEGLKNFLAHVAQAKFNVILVEYEDRFPYECAPELRGPGCFTKETLQDFLHGAERAGIKIVPLVQTLGHLEFLLKYDAYADMREVKEIPQQLCPSSSKALRLLDKMVKEIIQAHPKSPAIHIGGDECWQLGSCPTCATAAGQNKLGKINLYLKHISRYARMVKSAKKEIWMWDDMLRCDISAEQKKMLPKGVNLVYWDYKSRDGQYRPTHLPHLEYYVASGWKVLGGSAASGADAWNGDIPNYNHRMDNADWWAEAAEVNAPISGHVVTAWTRYNSLNTPCDPLPVSWPPIFYAAERLWHGLGSSRESFDRRLMSAFFGLRSEQSEAILAFHEAGGNRPWLAGEILARLKRNARRNRDFFDLTECAATLRDLIRRRKDLFEQMASILPELENGKADHSATAKMKKQVAEIGADVERIRRDMNRLLGKYCHMDEVETYLADRFLVFERLEREARRLLRMN